ncbi:MAG: glycerate kinase [Caldilineaceae bacterium]|nr:glycerate kinase [Caldilineaceae bacterium]
MPFDPSILRSNPRRRKIIAVLEAALEAVDPFLAVQQTLRRQEDLLSVGGQRYDLRRYRRILVIGAGKAGAPMTQAVESILGDRIDDGLVVVKTAHGGPTERVRIVEASHPVPDEAGVRAGKAILALAAEATQDDLVIALLSGGGSALLVAPAPELTLADKQNLSKTLLACGASINEINVLRKHCSAVKGGQLARAVAPATLITLVLSDVIGSPLDVIASGPTVPDQSGWEDAWALVQKYDLADTLPSAIVNRLRAGLRGEIEDTPKPGDPSFAQAQTHIVADNRLAAEAALAKAAELGYNTLLLSTFVEGEAAEVGRLLAALGKEVLDSGHPIPAPACLVLGGESTVTLGRESGKGGRNQELALSAALALQGIGDVTVVSLATDGTDGPTDSAGGLGDGATVSRGDSLGLSALDHLRRHNAYPYLAAVEDLLLTGPTRTNVNDLMFVFVEETTDRRPQTTNPQ